MDAAAPRLLFVYYTFTKQALKVTEDMEAVFQHRGWEIERAQIEFTDTRYTPRFAQFPFKHRYLDIIRLLPAQLRRATGEIRIPDEASEGHRGVPRPLPGREDPADQPPARR